MSFANLTSEPGVGQPDIAPADVTYRSVEKQWPTSSKHRSVLLMLAFHEPGLLLSPFREIFRHFNNRRIPVYEVVAVFTAFTSLVEISLMVLANTRLRFPELLSITII